MNWLIVYLGLLGFTTDSDAENRGPQRAYNKARKTQDKGDWDAFVTCQKELRKDLNKAEQDFISKKS